MHMITTSSVSITPLAAHQTDEAAALLARAFVANPLHVAAFGAGQLAANETFFTLGLSVMRGSKVAAMQNARMAGVIHWIHSPACQISTAQKARMFLPMLRGLGLHATRNVVSWLSAWSTLDHAQPHVHVGPIGVDPSVQRRGVGQRLMEACCAAMDRDGIAGVLETDRPENVLFYQRFGFTTTTTHPVLGVPNFFMHRHAR